jgi:hypothetical protein
MGTDGTAVFVDGVEDVLVWVKDEVARPLLGFRLDLRRIVRRQCAGRFVEAELVDGVRRAGVRDEREAIGAVELNAMSVFCGLDPLQRLLAR